MTANNGTPDESQERTEIILPTGTTAPDGAGGTNKAPATQIADQLSLHSNGFPPPEGDNVGTDIETQPAVPVQPESTPFSPPEPRR